ncbi:WD domain, G-beta repeat-containing protein [Cystoisospora suis]|uniref:WD domain, G-beta repeat-containing protein n=1 Tax=Cystoisospora suis TaxID=483139 RepID=A0A2C6KXR8_9APIC|nr:WD domain, G-beta repeat-containing protein [Cystoisospora suis]
MTATNGTSEAPPASLSAGAQPDPLVPSSSASHTHSFLDSYTPLHTFSVLLQQTQKRTHALFVNNVGLKPQPFLPAVEEKIKMKLSDEYFFPPLVPPSAAASQVPPDSPPALSVTPPFATLGGQESSEGKPRARLPLALPPSSSPGAAQSSSSNVRKPQSVSVSAPDMTVGDLVAELSAHITCSSGADLPSSSTSHTDPASGRTLALRDEGTAGRSKGSPLNGAALAVTGGSVESVGGGGVLSSLGTGRGELANLRLKNLPAALRPTWHAPWKLHRVISGHLGWVTCLAVDPTNDWFATGSNDRLIKIWDLASGTLKLSLTGHVSAIRDVKISARHPYMFTCGEDNRVKCWDLEQNKVVRDYHGHLSG